MTKRSIIILGGLLSGLSAAMAHADEVHADRIFREVTIRRFDGEVVVFVPRGAESMARRLADISQLRVDSVVGLEPFNQGEEQYAAGDYAAAVQSYRQALPRARDFWKALILVRYLDAADRGGDLVEATRTYIQLVQILPDKGHAYLPRGRATAGADQRRAALALVDRLFGDVANQEARWQVEAYRLELMHSVNDPRCPERVQSIIREIADQDDSPPRWRLRMGALRLHVEAGAFADARACIDQAIAVAPRRNLAELLFLKGRCLYELGGDRDARLNAALAFMRCAVYFEDSAEAPAALLWAGRIHEDIGRPQESITLYRECLDMRQADDEVLRQATAALERLGH